MQDETIGFIESGTGDDAPAARSGRSRFSRRRLLGGALVGGLLAVGGGAAYARWLEPVWVEVVRRPMPLVGLKPGLQGFRIIQLSDLHVGDNVPMSYLERVVEKVNGLAPDLVVVTGDIIDRGRSRWMAEAAGLVARIRAPYGTLATLGNHDWAARIRFSGSRALAGRVAAALEDRGIRVLRNAFFTVTRGGADLHVAGLEDYWGADFDPAAAFADVPGEGPCIALSHNPDSFFDLSGSPAQWVLAGHTHGGQVSFPFWGAPILPVRHKAFVAGTYGRPGRRLYVNRGIGWLKRVRFNARPEITVFTLQSSRSDGFEERVHRPDAADA